jgi:hypothetical protein
MAHLALCLKPFFFRKAFAFYSVKLGGLFGSLGCGLKGFCVISLGLILWLLTLIWVICHGLGLGLSLCYWLEEPTKMNINNVLTKVVDTWS